MITLNFLDALSSLLFVALAIGISQYLKLSLTQDLIIAAIRCIIQLCFVGLILSWVFINSHASHIIAILTLMTLIAASAAIGRTQYPYHGIFLDTLLALFLGCFFVAFFAVPFILKTSWKIPQFIIPILGMILGNALTAISLTTKTILNHLHQNQGHIYTLLALSASPKESILDAMKLSIKNGMTPTIQSLMVVGVVSLPGMMTGQILAGENPITAAYYQIVILFAICASGLMSCTVMVLLIMRRFFNQKWQLNIPQKPKTIKEHILVMQRLWTKTPDE